MTHSTGLSLTEAGDIAQIVLAATGVAALASAYAQIRVSHNQGRRSRVYEFSDMLGQQDWIAETARCQIELPKFTSKTFKEMPETEQLKWLRLPNLVEEIAYLYNRGNLDRTVAAELLGVFVERLWGSCGELMRDCVSRKVARSSSSSGST